MSNCVSHSRNVSDELTLRYLDQHLQQLTQNQKAALAIAALFEVTEPKDTCVAINSDCCKFHSAVELLLQLSVQGKLALVRAIAEELVVLEHLKETKV